MAMRSSRWFFWVGVLVLFSGTTLRAQKELLDSAKTLLANKKYKNAELLLEKAYDLKKSDRLKDLLADTYAFQAKWDSALPLYRALQEDFPENAEYHFKYGGALGRKAQNVSRLKALTLIGSIKRGFLQAAKLDSQHIDARWGLIEYYLAIPGFLGGGIKKCEPYAEELLAISPVEGYFAQAYLYELKEEKDKATKAYLKMFQHLDDHGTVERNQLNFLIGKACSEFEREENKGINALKAFIKRHSVKDGVPVSLAYYHLAKLYRLKKDRKEASFWIGKAASAQLDNKLLNEEKAKIHSL